MTRRSDAGRGALEDLQFARRAPTPVITTPIEELELILERVRRLRYDHNNPERFHAERSDVTGALGGLVKRMRAQTSTASVPTILPLGRSLERSVRSTEARGRGSPGRPILHLKGQG